MVIIKKRAANGEVEVFEISESELQTFKIASAVNNEAPCEREAIDLYKMEYKTCAERYNNLYSAAWTNFSYMALFAGGIFTFGGTRLVIPLTAFLACLPLLFWWIATFEPLNRYGDDVQTDLGRTERALNALSISSMVHIPEEAKKGLSHFQDFASRASKTSTVRILVKWVIGMLFFLSFLLIAFVIFLGWQVQLTYPVGFLIILGVVSIGLLMYFERTTKGGSGIVVAFKQLRRVRFLVRASAAVLLITAICFGVRLGTMISNGEPLTLPKSEASAPDLTH